MLRPEVEKAMKNIEKLTGMKFGDKEMPLLVSVRSGARASMPGMMDTILNLGMNDQAVEAGQRTEQPAVRLGFVSPLRTDVRRRGAGHETRFEGRPRPVRGDHRGAEGQEGREERHRPDDRRPQGAGEELQGRREEADRRGFPDLSVGPAVGSHLRRVRLVDERTRHPLPQTQQHPRRVGHGRIGTGHGIRQHGREFRDGRSLLARRRNG